MHKHAQTPHMIVKVIVKVKVIVIVRARARARAIVRVRVSVRAIVRGRLSLRARVRARVRARLRPCVQLLLSVPLALGLRTSRVAATLAVLHAAEALLMWQWWRPAVLDDSQRLLRVSEHFTVNLAVSGSLMLLAALGSGRFTVDQLLKKSD